MSHRFPLRVKLSRALCIAARPRSPRTPSRLCRQFLLLKFPMTPIDCVPSPRPEQYHRFAMPRHLELPFSFHYLNVCFRLSKLLDPMILRETLKKT
jgi:hypothetical protein